MSKADRLAQLEELKRLRKSGESRIKTYNPEEEQALYDVVDADDYMSDYDDDDEFIEVNNGDHSYNRNDGYNDIGGGRYGDKYSDEEDDNPRYLGNSLRDGSKRKRTTSKKDSVIVEEPQQPKIRSKDIAQMLRQNQKPKQVRIFSFIFYFQLLTVIILETHYVCRQWRVW